MKLIVKEYVEYLRAHRCNSADLRDDGGDVFVDLFVGNDGGMDGETEQSVVGKTIEVKRLVPHLFLAIDPAPLDIPA